MKSISLKWILISSLLIAFASCDKEKPNSPVIEKDFSITGFTRVYALDGFNVSITKGDNFSIKAKGPARYVNDMKVNLVTGNILDLKFQNNWNNRPNIDVTITLPDLIQVNLAAAGKAVVTGFEDDNHVLRAVLSGASRCSFNGAPINVSFDISGGSQLDVTGTTLYLYGTLSGAGKLNAYGLISDEVDIDASGGSEAYVKVVNSLFASATGGSRVYYKGNPTQKYTETSGGGQIIQE